MTSPLLPFDPDEVATHRAALLRLARSLTGQEQDAQDVVQDALVVGLTRGRSARRGVGAWLAGVTRNRAARTYRDRDRRRRREARAARPEEATADADPVATLKTQRRLLRHVEMLDEPFRTAVVLRYFESLPPRRIAERLEVPVATVKSRLRRGVVRLRDAMDGEHGGTRSAWAGPLLGSSAAWQGAAGAGGMTIMGWKGMCAVGVVLLALAGGAWWSLGGPASHADAPHPKSGSHATAIPDTPGDAPPLVPLAGAGTQADATPEGGGTSRFRVHGRVLAKGRHPAVAADVHLRVQGRIVARGSTDADGRYRLAADAPTFGPDLPAVQGFLWASHGGRWAHAMVHLSPKEAESKRVATLVLEPARALRIHVRTAEDQPAADASVWVSWQEARREHSTGARRRLHGMLARTDDQGRATLPRLAHGLVGIYVVHGRRLASQAFRIQEGMQDDRKLVLPSGLPTTVHVRNADTGASVSGATFRFACSQKVDRVLVGLMLQPEQAALLFPPTGPKGATVGLAVPPGMNWQLAAHAPRGPTPIFEPGGWTRWTGPQGRVELEVAMPPTDLRIPIDAQGAVVPVEGTPVRFARHLSVMAEDDLTLPETGRVEQGHVVIPAWRPSAQMESEVRVQTADGAIGLVRLSRAEDAPAPVAFRPGTSLEVLVTFPSGAPVAGAQVFAKPKRTRFPGGAYERVATNAEGQAQLPAMWPEPMELVTYVGGRGRFGAAVTQAVDLTSVTGPVTVTLPPAESLRVHVTVDGTPGLPSRLAWTVAGETVPEHLMTREDPVRGTLEIEYVGRAVLDGADVHIRAPGMGFGTGTLERKDGHLVAVVALESQLSIHARVTPHGDTTAQVGLERFAPEYGRWYEHGQVRHEATGATSSHTWDALAPGRYRLVDHASGIRSPAVTLEPGGDAGDVHLDLGRLVIVDVRVALRGEFDPTHAAVILWSEEEEARVPLTATRPGLEYGEGSASSRLRPWGSLALDGQGRVSFAVDPTQRHALRAWHPRTGTSPPVPIPAGGGRLALSLPHSPTIRFRVPGGGRGYEGLRVAAWRGDADLGRVPDVVTFPDVSGNERAFGGLTPGRWSLWIHMGASAPVLRSGVVVTSEGADLGELVADAGRAIEVRFQVPEGKTRPNVRLRATPVGPLSLYRGSLFPRARPVRVAGFLPGRYQVMVRSLDGGRILFDDVVTVPEAEDVVLELDLRPK